MLLLCQQLAFPIFSSKVMREIFVMELCMVIFHASARYELELAQIVMYILGTIGTSSILSVSYTHLTLPTILRV